MKAEATWSDTGFFSSALFIALELGGKCDSKLRRKDMAVKVNRLTCGFREAFYLSDNQLLIRVYLGWLK